MKQIKEILSEFKECIFDDLDPSIIKPRKIEPEKYGHKRKIPQGYEIFNDDWALSSTGDMFCIESYYEIYDNLLNQSHWILHLMEKWWFDANTFIPAYFEACKRAGIKEVRIKTYY